MAQAGNRGELARRLTPYIPRVAAEWNLEADGDLHRRIEGTLCFVDVSGFTALSEKLAQKGRIGAEELTEILNSVFASMLDLAYERGGSLLKFGGDALLLLFRRGDHQIQACSAAVEMRSALRTAPGNLRMSTGVHTGIIDLFLVGRTHKELIVGGPVASRTARLEHAAKAGEILVSGDVREHLPRGSAEKRKGPGFALVWRKPRLAGPGIVPRRNVPTAEIESCVSDALREHLGSGMVESEHRYATIGFVKFSGLDYLIEQGAGALAAPALDGLLSAIQRATADEQVTFLATDIDTDGGKVILTTGVPQTREDDEGRMLRALREIADHTSRLDVRIGVNRGHVFSCDIGTGFRRTYTVMGDAVNVAARLMAAASPGEVYAEPGVLTRSGTLFETTALPPLQVKGKAAPVRAFSLGTEIGARTEVAESALPFVGRARELESIRRAIQDLRSGKATVLAVEGDTGIGKSRLVEEALAGQPPGLVVRGEPQAATNAYRPFRDVVRQALGIQRASQAQMRRGLRRAISKRAPDLLPSLPLIGDATHIDVPDNADTRLIEPRFRPRQTASAVAELLTRVTDGRVIVVEDSHWLDEQSSAVLQALAESAEDPWLLLITRRPDPTGFNPTTAVQVRLGPLTDAEARETLMAATVAAPLRPDEIRAMVDRAGGNPLFLEQLVRAVSEGGMQALPESLDAVVGAQIDGLDTLPRRVLQISSVLGRSFRPVILEQMLGAEGLDPVPVTSRSLAEYIRPEGDDRLGFVHALVQHVAYEGLSYRRRRELHHRAAEAIRSQAGSDANAVAPVLAHHFSQAGSYEEAWQFAVVAGDRARHTYSNVEAASHYRLAVDAAQRVKGIEPAELGRVHEALGDMCELSSRFDEASTAYASARRALAQSRQDQGRLMSKQGLLAEKSGRLPVALAWFTRGLTVVGASPGNARAELLIAYAGIRFRQGKFREAVDLCQEALEDPGITDDQRGHAYYLLVTLYAHLGMPEASDAGRRAVEIYEKTGSLVGMGNVLNNLGVDAYYRGDWPAALNLYERSGEARRKAGDVIGAAASVNNVAEILSDQGRLEDAIAGFREALYVWESSSFSVGIALASINLGRALTRAGEFEEAERALARGLDLFADMGAESYVLETKLRLAELLAASGQPAKAAAEARTLLQAAPEDSSALMLKSALHRVEASGALAEGDVASAQAALDRALECAEGADSLYEIAATLELRHTLATDRLEVQRLAETREKLGIVG